MLAAGLACSAAPLAAVPAAAEEPQQATWPLHWDLNSTHDLEELSRSFDLDEDGIIDGSADGAVRLPEILNPASSTLRVDACEAPAEATGFTWQLARPGEAPLPAVTTAECATDLVLPDRPYPEARQYTLTVTASYGDGSAQVRSAEVRVQNVFIVGLGDSYGSGEGNPIELKRLFHPAKWDNRRCHRTRLSGQEQAARLLEQVPGLSVTFLHLACSGALASTGILEPYAGLIERSPALPPQVSQAAEYVAYSASAGDAPRYPDLVVTSIGGNDAQFAAVVKECLLLPPWLLIPIPIVPFVVPVKMPSCYEPGQVGDTAFPAGLARLPDLYADIDAARRGAHPGLPALCDPTDPCPFLITEYPDASTDENGDPCLYYAPGLSQDEFEWVIDSMVPRLNGLIGASARSHGWRYVDGIRSRFVGHGICAADDWMRDVLESVELQADINGSFHPDAAGHLLGYAPAIAEHAAMELGFAAPAPTFLGPMYGSTGSVDICDQQSGEGEEELAVTAPSTDASALAIPEWIIGDLANAYLPSGSVYASSCRYFASPSVPSGEVPVELHAGRPGCPDDPRPCMRTSAALGSLKLPEFGDPSPQISVRSEADAARDAGDAAFPMNRRHSDSMASGTTAYLAVAAEGQTTVSGEIVVDLTSRAQVSGAGGHSRSIFRLDATAHTPGVDEPCETDDECITPYGSGSQDIGRIKAETQRAVCRETETWSNGCRRYYGHGDYRYDWWEVYVEADGDTLVDDWGESDGPFTPLAVDASVRFGLAAPAKNLRLPYSVPAGSVIVIDVDAESYVGVEQSCVAEENPFRCTAHARTIATVSVDPDGETGLLTPLSGFTASDDGGDAPQVAVTSPVPGDLVPAHGDVEVTAHADSEHPIEAVAFLLDGEVQAVDEDGSDGWGADLHLDGSLAGSDVELTAIATDVDGRQGTSDPVTLHVADLPVVSVEPIEVGEGDGTASFTVRADGVIGEPVRVRVATVNGTAEHGTDYERVPARWLELSAASPEAQVDVAIHDDAFPEPDETFKLSLSNVQRGSLGVVAAVATIVDDDGPPPVVRVGDAVAGEDAGEIAFEVSVDGDLEQPVRVQVRTVDGTARAADGDYVPVGPLWLEFTPGGPTTQLVPVTVIDDAHAEPNETLRLRISAVRNAAVETPRGTGTIVDDDGAAPTLAIGDVVVDESAGTAVVPVTVEGEVTQPIQFELLTRDGTAWEGSDYAAVEGVRIIEPSQAGELHQIVVPILDDDLGEPIETFTVRLRAPKNVLISKAIGVVTVVDDDDSVPTLSVEDITVGEGDGHATFTVTLDEPSPQRVQVRAVTSASTTQRDLDFVPTTTAVVFEPGEQSTQVTVPVVDDSLPEPTETFRLRLVSASNAEIGRTPGVATIVDDDGPPPVISIGDVTVAESAAIAVVPVTVDAPVEQVVTFEWRTADRTAVAGEDYVAVPSTPMSFVPGGPTTIELHVALIDDGIAEPQETFRIILARPREAVLQRTFATVRIV